MTMPHLMNCPHSPDGWCLDCVKQEHDRMERYAAENERLRIKIGKEEMVEGDYATVCMLVDHLEKMIEAGEDVMNTATVGGSVFFDYYELDVECYERIEESTKNAREFLDIYKR